MPDNIIKIPKPRSRHEKTVRGMYDIFSFVLNQCGINELTEGRYENDPNRPYALAQELQQKHLLKLAGLKAGNDLIDIGCGHGFLLKEAIRQSINGAGITLSPDQMKAHYGLDTYLLNWRDIVEKKPDWYLSFNAVTAIGSLEHFVSPEEAADGKKEKIYRAFFDVCRWLLKPGGRLVVTAIHYLPGHSLPPELAQNQLFRPSYWRNPYFHLGTFAWLGGAYYPTVGELGNIAELCGFKLVAEEDGTLDYFYTSEVWLKKWKKALSRASTIKGFIHLFKRYRWQVPYGLLFLNLFQSWNWQFRKRNNNPPPTRLLRYVWVKK